MNLRDLVKSFNDQKPFSGGYDENLGEVVDVYEDVSRVCDVNAREQHKAMGIMFNGPWRVLFKHVRESVS